MLRATMNDIVQTSGQPQLMATAPPYVMPVEKRPVTAWRTRHV